MTAKRLRSVAGSTNDGLLKEGRMRKKWFTIIIIACVLMMGCQKKTYAEYLRQPKENITAIELLRFVNNEHVTIYTLENEQIDGFVEKVCAFDVSNVRGYPTDNCGLLAVRIYYFNGDVEMLGNEAFKYTTAEGETDLDDWHSVRYADLYELFAQYVEVSGLPVPD